MTSTQRSRVVIGRAPNPPPPRRPPAWLGGDAPSEPLQAACEALGAVYDPELCLDVVSLGLVYDVRLEDGTVVAEMTLTTPGCPVSEVLPEMAEAAVADALGPSVGVEVRVVWDPPWHPGMMTEEAATALGLRC